MMYHEYNIREPYIIFWRFLGKITGKVPKESRDTCNYVKVNLNIIPEKRSII
jgi:hypothetical protein